MNKSETETFNRYKTCCEQYKKDFERVNKKLEDLKTYLQVNIKMAEINDQETIITEVYRGLLKYLNE